MTVYGHFQTTLFQGCIDIPVHDCMWLVLSCPACPSPTLTPTCMTVYGKSAGSRRVLITVGMTGNSRGLSACSRHDNRPKIHHSLYDCLHAAC